MSMTKRYLESLPEGEQNAILGRHDEWADDVENEPSAEELAEWARALMEEDDNQKEETMNSLSEEVMTGAVIEKVFLNETGEKTDLEKLIADSIAQRDARRAAEEAERQAGEARYEALFHSIIDETIELVKPEIPAALHRYIEFKGAQPSNRYMLDARKWSPLSLEINAPGLAALTLNIGVDDDDKMTVWNISVDGSTSTFSGDQWPEAIAAAFDRYHERRAEYSKAVAGL